MYGSHLGSVNIYVLVCIQYIFLYNLYISTGDNPRALASRVSPVQWHTPYNNVLIDLACICTLRIVRKSVIHFGVSITVEINIRNRFATSED